MKEEEIKKVEIPTEIKAGKAKGQLPPANTGSDSKNEKDEK